MQIRIGDHVKFLSEKTEGKVTGIIDKDTVNVYCEEYGFEIPASISDLVVVAPDGDLPKQSGETAVRESPLQTASEPSGALLLAFVPDKLQALTEAKYELFLVNDTKQTALYSLFFCDENGCRGISAGSCNSCAHVPLGLFSLKEIDTTIKAVHVQAIFFTKGKTSIAAAVDARVKINPVNLCKAGSYKANKWCRTPAWLVSVNEEKAAPLRMTEFDAASVVKEKSDRNPVVPSAPPTDRPLGNVVEIDLHIHQLLDSTSGMSNHDILEYQLGVFRKTLEQYKLRQGQKIVFIHGKGDGVLRRRILWELQTAYKRFQHQDASFKQYGFGATLVVVK